MRIFLCDFSFGVLKDVAIELKKNDCKIVYWTGHKQEFDIFSKDKEMFPDTIFHNVFDAIRGVPAIGINENDFEAPGEDLLGQLLECESNVLSMMLRMDYAKSSIMQKKDLYHKYIQYWSGVLKKYKPEVIIFFKVPHIAYNLIIYYLAKYYKIPVLMFSPTKYKPLYLLTDDYKEASTFVLEEYEKIKDNNYTLEDLPEFLKNDFKNILNNKSQSFVFKQKRIEKMDKKLSVMPSLEKILKNIKSGKFLKTTFSYLKMLFINNNANIININITDNANYKGLRQLKKAAKIKEAFKREYLSLQSQIDLNSGERFIYCPLHYQPENSTCPLGGYFANQILMIKILASCLPENWKLYVKENIVQWDQYDHRAHLARYKGYYKEIARLPNVKLVSAKLSSFKLTNAAQAVSTITGTAGWEALVKGKPVIYFGYPWYMYCDGAMRVYDKKSCKQAIEKIKNGYKPDFQKVINFAMAMHKAGVKGIWENNKSIYNFELKKEAVKNTSQALLREIEKIKKYLYV